MEDLRVEDLMDDINTDAMTPAWACFDYRPEDIARNAYAGITVGKERLFPEGSLMAGNFEVIVSGLPQGRGLVARDRGAGREVVGDPHRHRGLVRAHPRPQQHQPGRAHGRPRDAACACRRARASRSPSSREGYDRSRGMVIEHGGLFPFTKAFARGEVTLPAAGHRARGR